MKLNATTSVRGMAIHQLRSSLSRIQHTRNAIAVAITMIVAVMLVIVFFGVRGEGAGSSRELARKAVAKLRR